MSEEKVYLKQGDVTVTNTRVVISGKTYAMTNITSVTMGKQSASILPPFIAITVGVIIAAIVGGTIGNLIAVASIIGGIVLFITRKPNYVVRIGSASGEADALESQDQDNVQKIVNAVNEAIVNRG